MSNIIPLPFESALSTSYADVSELAQAMQHLKCHLAHVVNIQITSKCFLVDVLNLVLMMMVCRFVGVVACSVRGGTVADEGVNGAPGTRKPGYRGYDGTVVPCAQL